MSNKTGAQSNNLDYFEISLCWENWKFVRVLVMLQNNKECHFTWDLFTKYPLTQPNLPWRLEKIVSSPFNGTVSLGTLHPVCKSDSWFYQIFKLKFKTFEDLYTLTNWRTFSTFQTFIEEIFWLKKSVAFMFRRKEIFYFIHYFNLKINISLNNNL